MRVACRLRRGGVAGRHGAKRKPYGTLCNVLTTATHAVCPICGKSSSLKTFPAGSGTDIVLQTYQGLGRGRGFSVVSRESGIDDRVLALALKPKLLDLLSVLTAHGHITDSDIASSVVGGSGTRRIDVVATGDGKPDSLKGPLKPDTETRVGFEGDVAEVRVGLVRLLGEWRDAERREALSQRKFDEIRERTERLAANTRHCFESMQRLQAEVGNTDRGAKELADFVRDLQGIVEDVHALRASQQPTRPRHDAR